MSPSPLAAPLPSPSDFADTARRGTSPFPAAADHRHAREALPNVGDLADVSGASPSSNDVFKWNGSLWVPGKVAHSELSGVSRDQHHNEDHASRHATGGGDALTPAQIGAIAEALVDAKGDLIVGTADDTPARMGVGTDGYRLVADSSETPGLKWVPVPAKSFAALTNDDLSATSAWEQWGTEEATLPNPSEPGTLYAYLAGEVDNNETGGAVFYGVRLGVSDDGGSTWSYNGSATYVIAAGRDYPVARSMQLVSSSPSGELQARAEIYQGLGTAGNVDYEQGRITLEWWPD